MRQGQRFEVRREDLSQARSVPIDIDAALALGEVRVEIEQFALSANNITYAVFGDSMHYWQFFPASEGYGCIPVWGFARVVASACDEVAVGLRVYGYLPMATHAVLTPSRVSAQHFMDATAHRLGLPAAYNQYRVAPPGANDGATAVLRPLFTTAFLIDDFLAEQEDFGARTLLLSSASSKTAWATAYCLANRAERTARRVGVTTLSRRGFVESLGLFSQVLGYDELAALPADEPTLYIDFSGDAAYRRAVHERFGDRLVHSSSIGGTHHDALGSARGLPGPRPTLFFAPSRLQYRAAAPPAGWGWAGLADRIEAAWQGCLACATQGAMPWLVLETRHGAAAIEQAYAEVRAGHTDPRCGLVLGW